MDFTCLCDICQHHLQQVYGHKKKNYIIIYIIRKKKKKNLYLLFSTLLLSFKWINKSVKFKQIDNVHLIRCVHVW